MSNLINNSTGKTRVTAKYIRKLASQYNVEIKHPLRSQEIKAFYVYLISEAIIQAEVASMTTKERNICYLNEINEALEANGNRFKFVGKDWLNFNGSLYCGSRFVGTIGGDSFYNAVWFKTSGDGRNVQRPVATFTQAVNSLIGLYLNSLKTA